MTTKRPNEDTPAEAGGNDALDEGRKLQHPASNRFRKVNAAGGASAYTVAEQWDRVSEWHAYFKSDQRSDYPVLESFDIAWEELDDVYKFEGRSIIERGADLQRVSRNPLSSLFYFIDMGFYPPPELMLTLLDCWDVYMANSGKMSLEEAFLGPSKKGIGNFSARTRSKHRWMHIRFEFDRMLREGMTRSEIAEELSNRMGGKPDADSILRAMRGFNGLFARHADQEEEK